MLNSNSWFNKGLLLVEEVGEYYSVIVSVGLGVLALLLAYAYFF